MVIILTLCSANYLAHAKSLGDSVREHNPDFHFVIGLVDRLPNELPLGYLDGFEVIPVEDFLFPEFADMSKKYNIVELNTAVKPFYMEYLYKRDASVEAVIYLDPDTRLYGSLMVFVDKLKYYNIILTPHSCTYDDSPDSMYYEKIMLWVGVYNIAIHGTRRSPVTDAFLKWWKIRVFDNCYFKPGVAGSFFDQLWMVLVPIYFPGVYVEKDPGYNFCFWNHFERRLEIQDGKYIVNGQHDLVLVHFSGYKPENPEASVSRSTEPIASFAERPDLRPIYDDYRSRLLARNYALFKSIPWHFAPPPVSHHELHGKRLIKGAFKRLFHCLPRGARGRLKRLAELTAKNC